MGTLTRRNVKDFTGSTDALDAPRGLASVLVEANEPLGDAQWRCYFALVFRHEHAWRGGGWWEHDPIFITFDDSVPRRSGVWVLPTN